jgi:hypothetical protein
MRTCYKYRTVRTAASHREDEGVNFPTVMVWFLYMSHLINLINEPVCVPATMPVSGEAIIYEEEVPRTLGMSPLARTLEAGKSTFSIRFL